MLVLTLILLLPMAAGRAGAAEDISGFWYGEGYQQRRYLHWLAVHAPDGKFHIEFRQYSDCKLMMRSEEVGRWRYDKGFLITDISMLDGKSVKIHERYFVEKIDARKLEYRTVRTGTLHKARRVSEDFIWPDCDPARLVS